MEYQHDIINYVLNFKEEQHIINVLKDIHPVILLYYNMMNESFSYYISKMPITHFNININELVEMLLSINDAKLLTFIFNKTNMLSKNKSLAVSILEELIKSNKYNNEIINIINNNIKLFKVKNIAPANKPNVLELCLLNQNFDFYKLYMGNFIDSLYELIINIGDMVDIFKVIHTHFIKYPNDKYQIDFRLVFKSALINGYEKIMHYVLDNYNDNLYETFSFTSDFMITETSFTCDDTITYAILGKNINCVRHCINKFYDKLQDKHWPSYFNFAAMYGNLEILNFLIINKFSMINEIENFYENILQYSLCNGNYEIVLWALNNGAKYSPNMNIFIQNYNSCRTNENELYMLLELTGYYYIKCSIPENLTKKMNECYSLIKSNYCFL